MDELTLTLLRIGFLAVLWVFVLTTVGVMRSDLFGNRVAAPRVPHRAQPRQQRPPKQQKGKRSHAHRLVVTAGSLTGTSIQLGEAPVTIGRAPDSTLVLDDDYASTRHARIYPYDGQWVVEDLGSTNGTYLDRQKLTGPTLVPTGVPVRIGKTVLELRK